MSKYVIDLRSDCKVVQEICESDGQVSIGAKSINYLEELNSDYINEHYGDLQDTAYQRGLEEGKKAFDLLESERNSEYQHGLNDAWEVARKIIRMPEGKLLNIFTECYSAVCTALQVLLKYDASEAIEKLKAYEEKQKTDNCIEIGDEVEWNGDKYIVTYRNIDINMGVIQDYDLLGDDGSVVDHVKKCSFTKTGRHFDIQSILEEMRHD